MSDPLASAAREHGREAPTAGPAARSSPVAAALAARRVLVVVPAYNEADSLPTLIEELRTHAPQCDFVVVDDGSRDDTRKVGSNFESVPMLDLSTFPCPSGSEKPGPSANNAGRAPQNDGLRPPPGGRSDPLGVVFRNDPDASSERGPRPLGVRETRAKRNTSRTRPPKGPSPCRASAGTVCCRQIN